MLLVLFICAACNGTNVQEESLAVAEPLPQDTVENRKETQANEVVETNVIDISKTVGADEREKADFIMDEEALLDTDELVSMDMPAAEEKEVTIYFSNSNADGLEKETITVEEITPEIIITNLAKHNIVSIDTKIKEFDIGKDEEADRDVITLDMSKAFGEYIKTMGSSGENVIIAALTNTFLDAFEADALKLTVEGEVLETGHGIYEEELTYTNVDLNMAVE